MEPAAVASAARSALAASPPPPPARACVQAGDVTDSGELGGWRGRGRRQGRRWGAIGARVLAPMRRSVVGGQAVLHRFFLPPIPQPSSQLAPPTMQSRMRKSRCVRFRGKRAREKGATRPEQKGLQSGLKSAFPPPLSPQVVRVPAFCSVQDMIHAALHPHGGTATLREVRWVGFRGKAGGRGRLVGGSSDFLRSGASGSSPHARPKRWSATVRPPCPALECTTRALCPWVVARGCGEAWVEGGLLPHAGA